MPTPSGSQPWRNPAMTGYGGPRKAISSLSGRGLCTVGKKCFRKDGHDGDCYPRDEVPVDE
jgi:hypothetical protein